MFAVLAACLLLSTRLTGEVFGTNRGENYRSNAGDKGQLKLEEVLENPTTDS